VADSRFLPANACAAPLQPLDAGFQLLRPLRAPAGMPYCRRPAFGELQGMMKELAPAPEIDRLPRAGRFFKPKNIFKERCRLLRFWSDDFSVRQLCDKPFNHKVLQFVWQMLSSTIDKQRFSEILTEQRVSLPG